MQNSSFLIHNPSVLIQTHRLKCRIHRFNAEFIIFKCKMLTFAIRLQKSSSVKRLRKESSHAWQTASCCKLARCKLTQLESSKEQGASSKEQAASSKEQVSTRRLLELLPIDQVDHTVAVQVKIIIYFKNKQYEKR